jgi:hypothetical protein
MYNKNERVSERGWSEVRRETDRVTEGTSDEKEKETGGGG